MTKLETARLRLREMTTSDAPFLLEVLNEPAFLRNVGDRGVRTVADATKYLLERIASQYQSLGFGMWLVELRETGEAIGICGLVKRDALEHIDLGFSFLERFWRRGFAEESARAVMTYAWRVAELPLLAAIVAPQNRASIRLLGKLGFAAEKEVKLTPDGPKLKLLQITRPSEDPRSEEGAG
jgi:RimJ/RimL family protein N-acetyltransferase